MRYLAPNIFTMMFGFKATEHDRSAYESYRHDCSLLFGFVGEYLILRLDLEADDIL